MRTEEGVVNYVNQALVNSCLHGFAVLPDNTLRAEGQTAFLVTRMLDTGDNDCTFGRLQLWGDFAGAKLEVVAAAATSRTALINGEETDLEAWLQDPAVPPGEKGEALRQLEHRRFVHADDVLLQPLKGRYLWLWVALYPLENEAPSLAGLRLGLPWVSFTRYLPEIYQGNPFFERFVGIFQSMYMDLERQVDALPAALDYQTAPDEVLEVLAGWLGIDNSRGLFTPAHLRHIIANLDLYQGKKGTRQALEALVELVCGVRPRIVEHFQWMRPGLSAGQLETGRALYGEGPDHFCMMLDMVEVDELPVSEADLRWLIETNSPFGSRFKLVYLRATNHTDNHSYLDVNSRLSVPEVAGVETGALGGHLTVG